MLKVTLSNGRVLGISWNHSKTTDSKPVSDLRGGKETLPLRTTYCELYLIDGEGDISLVASGVAICSYLDQFVKEYGRKASLKDAMKAANLPEEDRERVWEFYLNRRELQPAPDSTVKAEPVVEVRV